MTPDQPQPEKPRSRKMYALWAVALTLLLAVAVGCWVYMEHVAPALAGDRAILSMRKGKFDSRDAIVRLGGPDKAGKAMARYLQFSAWFKPDTKAKDIAFHTIEQCREGRLPALVMLLRHTHPNVRGYAANLLGEMGPSAAEAAPAIEELRSDPVESVRADATWALKKIKPAESAKR